MAKDWSIAAMTSIPKCDFCDKQAEYDAATDYFGQKGPWAYMCQRHFDTMSVKRLGLGFGQRLVLIS